MWLATVLAPGEMSRLLGWPPGWPHESPLGHLVHEILAVVEPDHFTDAGLLGTLVLLPTHAQAQYSSSFLLGNVRMLELYWSDTEGRTHTEEALHSLLRRMHSADEELGDLVQALGHRLPWWPPGCATPALVAGWAPDTHRAPEHVPPPLAEAQAFLRRCESAAAELEGTLRASVLELGTSLWNSAASRWRREGALNQGALPKEGDASLWQVAVEFNLPPAPATTGDFWEGLEWAMEHAPSQRLARDALRFFGDPGSAGTVLVDTGRLPDPVRSLFTNHLTPAEAPVSYRAQRVLDALDAHPDSAAGPVLGAWPAPAGPAWCATSPGTRLAALHVPRVMPAEPSTGAPLETVLLRTEAGGDYGQQAPAIGFVVTDQDQILLLPAQGSPADLAAAIEHALWHPGTPTLVVGLTPSSNDSLIAAVDALVETGPRITPWEQLIALVRPHPADGYCPYCR